jgi:CBS domain-containing protein
MRTVAQLLQDKPRRLLEIGPDDSVLEAVQRMADNHVGALLVMRAGRLHGIVTERDYARKVILRNRTSANTVVREIMTAEVISVDPRMSATHCMQVMTERRIRHLPVLDGGSVVGIVSIGDLVRAVIEDQQIEIEHLQHYIAG